MKTKAYYIELIKKLDGELADMREKCVRENRDPIPDEIKRGKEVLTEIKEVEAIIDFLSESDETHERIHAPVTEAVTKPDPEKIAASDRSDKRDRFMSFGEQMQAVMRAGLPGGNVDPRLYQVRAASGLSEGIPSDGGFLVQQDFSSTLLKNVWETGLLASRCRRITISGTSNSIKINGIDETSRVAGSRWGGIRGYWAAEAAEKTASKPKFRKITLDLNKLVGLCYATDELLDDSAALAGILQQGFAEEFGFLLDDAIINGTGAGQPLGILNGGCVVSVAKETGQAAATLVYENIVKMWARIFARSRANSTWLINQDVEPQLHQMSLAVGTGGVPVYMPAGGASASPYSTLFGRPVLPIEQCATLGTTGDIYLADFAGGYVLAEKGGMQSDMSIHVRFIYDESVFRFVLRVDGQPVLSSAVTPYKGSNTLSHFVKLDARA